jgi:hypothetical protein
VTYFGVVSFGFFGAPFFFVVVDFFDGDFVVSA